MSAKDAQTPDSNPTEKSAPALAAEAVVKTGLAATDVPAELIEAAPQAETDATPASAPATPAAGLVAALVVQIGLATEQPKKPVVENGKTIAASNPPTAIGATPAEIAANALARVASDTSPTEVKAAEEPETEIQTPPPITKTEQAIRPDTDTTETDLKAAADLEAATETRKAAETAAADIKRNAKADTELAIVAKAGEPPKAAAAPVPHGRLIADAGTKADDKHDVSGIAPGQPAAKPESNNELRPEDNTAAQADPNKPVEAEARPSQRTAHDAAATISVHGPATTSDLPQPTGFGISHATAPHAPNVVIQAAQFTAVPAAGVAVPIGGLAVEIAANLQIGRSRFEIRLDPPELGRIDVRLDVDRQGQVTSHLIVERSATLDLLRRDAPQLERALQDAGLKTSDNGLQFSLRDQSQSGRNDDNDSGRNAHRLIVTEEDAVAVETAGRSYGRMIGQRGGVDIRV